MNQHETRDEARQAEIAATVRYIQRHQVEATMILNAWQLGYLDAHEAEPFAPEAYFARRFQCLEYARGFAARNPACRISADYITCYGLQDAPEPPDWLHDDEPPDPDNVCYDWEYELHAQEADDYVMMVNDARKGI